MVYNSALHDFFLRHADLVQVAEIEPQTAWTAVDPIAGPFTQIETVAERWQALPQAKYVHSVGMPLAGTRPPSAEQLRLLVPLAARLGCSYVSEHLSVGGTPHENAGFLLPPCQSDAGIAQAVRNIRQLQDSLSLPVAIETGVSYLPMFPGEIPDGDFVREIVLEADCGILLDIHNVYCNARNGRQPVLDFVAALPADRVWEMHIAGGLELDGYWLDAHSGSMPDDLVHLAGDLASGLPNLSAVVFEVFPSYLEGNEEAMLLQSIEQAHRIWSAAGNASPAEGAMPPPHTRPGGPGPSVAAWESELTRSIRMQVPVSLGNDFSLVPPLALYSRMTHSFRASALARLLPRTLYLIAAAGNDLDRLIRRYEIDVAAPLFALNEAEGFRRWCATAGVATPVADAMAGYEIALLRVPLEHRPAVVSFDGDPRPLFRAVADHLPPPQQLYGAPWEIEITPDEAGGPTLSPMGS